MSDIYFWEYSLQPRVALNSRSGTEPRRGALLRIGEGYGCIHPWPELGDEPLEVQLDYVRQGDDAYYTPLIFAALECAKADGIARRKGVSLFSEVVPRSHWLAMADDQPDAAAEEGFDTVKIKGGVDLEDVRSEISKWAASEFRVRLDFNESLPKAAFLEFWQELSDDLRESIELVEDPERWNEDGWMDLRNAGVPIAVDRNAMARYRNGDIFVEKPAFFTGFPNEEARFFVTSYMDHAVGQMYAAWRGSLVLNAPHRLTCGLLTHRCYEPDEFFEGMLVHGTRLHPAEGTGLGFDDLLEKLPWKRLT